MALQDNIAKVQLSLQTEAVSQTGFSSSIFITNDQRFSERVRSYASIEGVAEDFATTDKAYIALQQAFSQSPSPSVVKVGRTASNLTTASLTPQNVAENTQYVLTVGDGSGDFVTASYTAGSGDEAEDIVTALAGDINTVLSASVTASVAGTGSSATLEIVANTSSDAYYIQDEENLTVEYTSTEAPADTLQAIIDEDNDFYFIGAYNHTEAYVLALAAAVEALEKQYFVCVADTDSYDAPTDPATDTIGMLQEGGYLRTSAWYHQDADTLFPEMGYIALGSVYTPGTIEWANNTVAGSGIARNANGTKLTYTQRNNLDSKNANWVEYQGGVAVTRNGKTVKGELIDVVRSMDYWVARLTEGLQNKMINSNKIPYTDSGINEIRSVCNTVSERLVTKEGSPNVLQETNGYQFTFPRAADVDVADKLANTLRGTFVGYLAGAILLTEIQGVLTYEGLA